MTAQQPPQQPPQQPAQPAFPNLAATDVTIAIDETIYRGLHQRYHEVETFVRSRQAQEPGTQGAVSRQTAVPIANYGPYQIILRPLESQKTDIVQNDVGPPDFQKMLHDWQVSQNGQAQAPQQPQGPPPGVPAGVQQQHIPQQQPQSPQQPHPNHQPNVVPMTPEQQQSVADQVLGSRGMPPQSGG